MEDNMRQNNYAIKYETKDSIIIKAQSNKMKCLTTSNFQNVPYFYSVSLITFKLILLIK